LSTFISYSRTDSAIAIRLAKDLRSAGYDVWLDQLDIPTGARWDDEVEIALEACTTFMIVLSPESMQSQNVKDEIGYAIDAGKDILPVKIKPGDIPFRLRRFQYVDLANQPYQDSLKEIKTLLSPTGHLFTETDLEKKPSGAETQPSLRAVPAKAVTHGTTHQPEFKRMSASGTSPRTVGIPRALLIGVAAIALLAIAGFVFNALRANRAAEATPDSQAAIVDTSTPESPTASPTADTSQISTTEEVTQKESFLTNFSETGALADWEHLVLGQGRRNKVIVEPSSEGLMFTLDDPDLRAYYFYEPVIYEDAVLRMTVENLGQNTNFVSLICRRTGNTWYEFRIQGNGLWFLYNYNAGEYQLTNGGSQAIKVGKTTNEYEMRCTGNMISLIVNGETVKEYEIRDDLYTQGQVGLSVSSSPIVFPVLMKVLEYEVTSGSSKPVSLAGTPASETVPVAAPPAVQTRVSEKDGMTMVYVPAGEFTMGSDNGEPDEAPAHTVALDGFWIDQTEITNSMYATFLNEHRDQSDLITTWIDVDDEDLQINSGSGTWQAVPGYEDHPMIEVKWFGADAYCKWRGDGSRLPTEAEWEKAARGTTENLYAWGNEIDCSLANYGACEGKSVKVGSYLSNASPFGALDMTGNVLEWVSDWYAEDYYQNSPDSNPGGPATGEQRVLKGGSWDELTDVQVRTTARFTEPPDDSLNDGGLRCVQPE
jgi:formylglycine-generating enzyme required for sulfatase activity